MVGLEGSVAAGAAQERVVETATTAAQEAVAISGLSKSYGTIKAVQDLSLSIEKGEIFALLGPNGAGKTTTIEILEGYRKRDAGTVRVLGLDPENRAELANLKERMGVMLQQSSIYQAIRVGEAIKLFASYYDRPADTGDLLKMVGLHEHTRQYFKDLSGGQKQRMGLALALVGNPDILFLDEPTASMDPQARLQTWEIITGLKERGVTILLSTHYLEEAQRLADRVAIMDHGRLVALDTPDNLTRHMGGDDITFRAAPGLPTAEMAALPGARSASEVAQGQYKVTAADTDRLILALMLWANDRGLQPTNIKIERASLEDVFLTLTGEGVRD
ncbi:MAG: ABC transporter ATP-binding protein [Chloroflexia bacterium]